MTPKQKAEELFDKYNYLLSTHIFNGTFDIVKQFALIAVEEIIKSEKLDYLFTKNQINSMESTSDDRWIHETFIDYWEEVKYEIKKL